MPTQNVHSRRIVLKSSFFGFIAVAIPNLIFAKEIVPSVQYKNIDQMRESRYPAIAESIVSEVVGVAHFDLDRLKVLVNKRPELSKATWDWGFGDWETAIGAAAHTGRKDIAEYLLSMGARPDIFTFAMLGDYETIKGMIAFTPGLQRIAGPHGISLLQHAKNGVAANTSVKGKILVDYLSALGDADGPNYEALDDAEKLQYAGDYKYGEGYTDVFSVKVNSRKKLLFGKLGTNGGSLLKTGKHSFIYNGCPSVEIIFQVDNDKIIGLTVKEPDLSLIAKKLL